MEDLNGFIQLHRKMLDWEWYDDVHTFKVFVHLLLKVNWKGKRWRGVYVPAGSLITSLDRLSDETALGKSKVRRALNNLESTGEIERTSTHAYTLISVANWQTYQIKSNVRDTPPTHERHTSDTPSTHDQHASDTRPTSTEEGDKGNKGNKDSDGVKEAFDLYNEMAERTGLSTIQKVTQNRHDLMKRRLKDCGGIEGWKAAMEKVEASPFLTGHGPRGWKASIDFLLKESKFTKLMEGDYDEQHTGHTKPDTSDQLRQWLEEQRSG